MTHQTIDERDLVDRCLLKQLTPDEEAEFTEHLLECAECQGRMEEARRALGVLRTAGPEVERPSRWFLPLRAWGLAAALGALALYLCVDRRSGSSVGRPPGPPAGQSEAAPLRNIALESYRAGRPPASVLSAAAAAQPFAASLDLRGLARYPSYTVEIVDESGNPRWSKAAVTGAGGDRLEVTVDNLRVTPGLYWVRLSGAAAGGGSDFLREYGLQIGP